MLTSLSYHQTHNNVEEEEENSQLCLYMFVWYSHNTAPRHSVRHEYEMV